jgi:hypothetical protein
VVIFLISGAPSTLSESVPVANSLFLGALIASKSTQDLASDSWGNVKIPFLESLDSNPANESGWIPVPTENVSYSSPLGIIIDEVPTYGNATFEIFFCYCCCILVYCRMWLSIYADIITYTAS